MTTIRNDVFTKSRQIELSGLRQHRKSWDDLYLSEREALQYCLPAVTSVIDVGCMTGGHFDLFDKRSKKYLGLDIDERAIEIARKNHPRGEFLVGDFMAPDCLLPPADLALSFNVFDHMEDWKLALRQLRRATNRYILINPLMTFDRPTCTDRDLSWIYYGGGTERLLWAIHNPHEVYAYCATEDIQAVRVMVWCYPKYHRDNYHLSAGSVHPIPIGRLFVGSILIEVVPEYSMLATRKRPRMIMCTYDRGWHRHGDDALKPHYGAQVEV